MKQIFFLLLSFFITFIVAGQPLDFTISAKYKALDTDIEKGQLLDTYFGKAPIANRAKIANAFELISWFKQNNDEVGAAYSQIFIANVLVFKSDYSTALNMAFSALPTFENRKDNNGIMLTNNVIGLAYMSSKNYKKAIEYFKKVISNSENLNSKKIVSRTYNDLGSSYALAAIPDSGMVYAQKAISLNRMLKDTTNLAVGLSTLAENYMVAGENEIAIPFFKKSMSYYLNQKNNPDTFGIIYLNNNFAQAYLSLKKYDSVKHYANLSLAMSLPLEYKEQTLRSYEYLYKSFQATKQMDSVYKYYSKAMTLKDSVFSLDSTKKMEAMGFREQIRQLEIESATAEATQQHKQNIQLSLIGFGIISFVIIFLLLSHSFIISTNIIQFMGTVAMLLVFEFVYLLLHPYLETITHHSPVLMLIALVSIAALLVPLHHKAEKWAVTRLVVKNKEIRLAAAKKTIEELDI